MTDYAHLRALAEKQSAAYSKMLEYDEGVGGLGVRHPEMLEDMLAWDDLSENGHADTVLALLDRLEELEGRELEWEYATTQWGIDRQPHGRLTRGEITPEQWFAELGDRDDLELVRRRKAGEWEPVTGDDDDQ